MIHLAFKLFVILWAGLFFSKLLNVQIALVIFFISFLLFLSFFVLKSSISKSLCLLICWFGLSSIFGYFSLNNISSVCLKINPKQFLILEGQVMSEPRSYKQIHSFLFYCTKLKNPDNVIPVDSIIQASVFNYKGRLLDNGATLVLKGRMKPFDNDKPFDQYLKLNKVSMKLNIQGANVEYISPPSSSIMDIFNNIGNALKNSIELTSIDEDSKNIISTLVFGNRADLSKELKTSLINLNTYHAISISGMHFSFLALMLIWILGFLGIPRPWHFIFSIPLMLAYLLIIQFPPAASRAFLMLGFMWIAPVFGRKALILNLLGVSGLILLLLHPAYFQDPGFILSYYAMIVLVGPGNEITKIFSSYFDPWMDKYKIDETLYNRITILKKFILLPLIYSLIAWIGLFPMTAYYFHIFSWLSLPANILMLYSLPLILGCSMLASISGLFSQIIAEAYAHCASFVLKLLTSTLLKLNDLPFAYSNINEFNEKDLIIWSLILWIVFFIIFQKGNHEPGNNL